MDFVFHGFKGAFLFSGEDKFSGRESDDIALRPLAAGVTAFHPEGVSGVALI
jgi:hypothetical protein